MTLALNALLGVALLWAPGSEVTQPPPEGPADAPVEVDMVESPVQLVWDAPEGCADGATMQVRLDEAMHLQVEDGTTRKRWVIARVRQDGEQWTLRLWAAPEGTLSERALAEASCAELERATITIVAMLMPAVMVEPAAAPAPTPEDLEPKPAPEPMDANSLDALIGDAPESEPPPPDDGSPDMRAPPGSKLRGAVGFSGGYGRGTMPAPAGGLSVTAGLLLPKGRFELAGQYWGTRHIGLGSVRNARARYNLLSVALRGCGVPTIRSVELPMCGMVEAGSVIANVDGAALLHGPGRPIVLTGTSMGLNLVIAPTVALKFGAEGWIAIAQAEHRVLNGVISRSRRLGYRISGGVEFRFGGRRKAQSLRRGAGGVG